VSQTAGQVRVRAPAKINLQLAVGPLRPDGFHEIATVFQAIDLFDVLTAAPARSLTLRVHGDQSAGVPTDDRNLAWRAARLLADHGGVPACAELVIDKHIPVAAGLAGGSADAAAALLACNELWNLNLPDDELAELAGRLGSDVAFALIGRSAVGAGRGEHLTPIQGQGQFHWVLAAAYGELSTPAVYAELDRQRACGVAETLDWPMKAVESSGVIAAVASGDPLLLASRLTNDLQPAALTLAPYLGKTLAAGLEGGALAGIVSGSGPTCAFLTSDGEQAGKLAESLIGSGTCRQVYSVAGGTAEAVVSR